ncbi:collagen alpha-2(I) chain-like [Prinia subflava]|uniref:collagen alpha-2(I) chain-like n=1 Tax=Prinia subflava TaxID=208062 RepID=UPI002FE3653B
MPGCRRGWEVGGRDGARGGCAKRRRGRGLGMKSPTGTLSRDEWAGWACRWRPGARNQAGCGQPGPRQDVAGRSCAGSGAAGRRAQFGGSGLPAAGRPRPRSLQGGRAARPARGGSADRRCRARGPGPAGGCGPSPEPGSVNPSLPCDDVWIQKRCPECFRGPGWWSRLEAVAGKTRRSVPGSGLPHPLRGAAAGGRQCSPESWGDVGVISYSFSRFTSSFPGAAVPRASAYRRAGGQGTRPLPALQPWPPSAARGPRGQQQERLAAASQGPVCKATVPRHVEGREEPAFPPHTALPRTGREQARLGCPAPQLLPGAGVSVGEWLREQQKPDLQVQEMRKQWLSLPRQPALTRRFHVGGKLQPSVENSNTPGTSNDKRNNNDNNDNVFPYIKAQKINILLHPLPPWSPDLLNTLSFQYFGGWSRFERGTLTVRVKAGGDVTRVPFTFSREHNHCPCDKNLCYGLGAVKKRELCRSVS